MIKRLVGEIEFEISLLINDKGKKIRFFIKKNWEVEWKSGGIGIVSPKKLKFERDGKKYQVCVNVSISKKGFFYYGIYSYDFELPPNVDYQIYYSNEPKPGERSKMDNDVSLVNDLRVLFGFPILIFIVVIAFFIIRKKVNKKNIKKFKEG